MNFSSSKIQVLVLPGCSWRKTDSVAPETCVPPCWNNFSWIHARPRIRTRAVPLWPRQIRHCHVAKHLERYIQEWKLIWNVIHLFYLFILYMKHFLIFLRSVEEFWEIQDRHSWPAIRLRLNHAFWEVSDKGIQLTWLSTQHYKMNW